MAIWWRRETLDRQEVSERAIRWRAVRPRFLDGASPVDSRLRLEGKRLRDWLSSTKIKKVKATQNQRPQTDGTLVIYLMSVSGFGESTLNYSETHIDGFLCKDDPIL